MADIKSEDKKEIPGLTALSVGASAAGLALSVGVGVLQAMTGDVIGAAENFGTASSIFGKITGLEPVFKSVGKYFKENFVGKRVAGLVEKTWGVLTSKPVKLALKLTGVALVMASAVTPIGWAGAGLALAAATVGVAVGAVSAGKTKRLETEAASAKEILKNTGELENGKFPAINQFLSQKLSASQAKGVNKAAVGRETLGSNLAESAGLILEAVSSGDPFTAIASGISVIGNITGEASEAYKEKLERNELRAEIERTKTKAVCKIISNDPSAATLSQEDLIKKYKEVEAKYFPKENPIKTVFKDFARGVGPYFTNGIKKLFSKSLESHSVQDHIATSTQESSLRPIETKVKSPTLVSDAVLMVDPHDLTTRIERTQSDKHILAHNLAHDIEVHSHRETEHSPTLHEAPLKGKSLKNSRDNKR